MFSIRLNLEGDLTYDFVSKVIPGCIKDTLLNNIKSTSIYKMDSYLKRNQLPSIEDIIITSCDNIKIDQTINSKIVRIYFDPNILVKNIPLVTLLKLINYGNIEVRGTKLISNSIDYIKHNISNLFKLYMIGGFK